MAFISSFVATLITGIFNTLMFWIPMYFQVPFIWSFVVTLFTWIFDSLMYWIFMFLFFEIFILIQVVIEWNVLIYTKLFAVILKLPFLSESLVRVLVYLLQSCISFSSLNQNLKFMSISVTIKCDKHRSESKPNHLFSGTPKNYSLTVNFVLCLLISNSLFRNLLI